MNTNSAPCRLAIVIIIAQLLYICHLQLKLLTLDNKTANAKDISFPSANEIYRNTPHPVDIVITWVNGSEKKFLKQLHTYRNNMNIQDDVNSDRRYNNKNELKFALRSIEKNMPWIQHVYIVTNGQVPNWLDLDNGYTTVIPHDTIFQNKLILPTFSSPAIEANLHRIPGLSKHFLYFNDDWLIAKPVEYSTFFTKAQGMIYYWEHALRPCSHLCPWSLVHNDQCNPQCNVADCQYDGGDCKFYKNALPAYVTKLMSIINSPYEISLQTTQRLFNNRFGYNARYILPHMPILVDKDIMADAWKDFKDELANTSEHRFRDNWDMQFQFFYTHYTLEKMIPIELRQALKKFDRNEDGRIGYLEVLNMRAMYDNETEFDNAIDTCIESFSNRRLDVDLDEMANCSQLGKLLKNSLLLEEKYKSTLLSKVPGKAFYHMIHMTSHFEYFRDQLNSLRRLPATFICINDDLDHNPSSESVNQLIYKELALFYEGMFPIPSKYELVNGAVNKFNYLKERVDSTEDQIEDSILSFNNELNGGHKHGWIEFLLFGLLSSCLLYLFFTKWRFCTSYWK